MTSDDELYRVHNVFLGPRGFTLPWRARYSAYGLCVSFALVALAVESRMGIRGLWPLLFTVAGAVAATMWAEDFITYECPVRAYPRILAHEVSAPRPRTPKGRTVAMSAAAVRRRPVL
ncbi:hypothetical protein ACFY1V_31750 [Streptomyces sp. NPDC001255]|uniref:hypothetical protein n=1 Tax=Streptomyces sp. NPDC001255 TaxID=3364550 RepID=UPI0036B6DA7D